MYTSRMPVPTHGLWGGVVVGLFTSSPCGLALALRARRRAFGTAREGVWRILAKKKARRTRGTHARINRINKMD